MAASAVTLGGSRATPWTWLWSAIAAACVIVLHVPSFVHRLMDGDEAVYGAIAALMNQGGRLYADGGVDNKPPGIYWLYAATFEVFGRYQMTAIHAVELVAIGATCGVLVAIGWTLSCRRAGILAAVLYGVLTASGNPRLLAANSEVFMMLPLTAAFLLLLRRQWFWSALLMVAGGAFKQVAAVEVLLLPLALVLLHARPRRVRGALLAAAGLAAGLAAGAALLAVTGSIPGFWRWTVEILVGYASGNWTAANILARAQDSLVPFVMWGAFTWIAALASAARWRALAAAEKLAVVWLALSFIGAIASGHLAWHYFIQVMPPLALLAALTIERALGWERWRWAVAAVTLVGVAVPAAYWFTFDLRADPLTYDWTGAPAQHEQVAGYMAAHSGPSDRVFVWGVWAALYVESDRDMATRFPQFLSGYPRGSGTAPVAWDTAPDVWPLVLSDLERNPPALIVDTSTAGWSDFTYAMNAYPLLGDYVAAHYRQVATVDGVAIYARVT
jgi:4-amino-4-deoxy-L-arabinose transferase-like glycosyltransferase